MSFLSSLLNIFTSFTVSIKDGFSFLPATKFRNGTIFADMQIAVNFVNQEGQYFLGQAFGGSSVLSQPSFQQAPPYQPGQTTPPRAFPTFQPNGYQVPLGVNDPSMYSFSAEGMRHLKSFERLSQRPYFVNGQKFIGYGHKLPQNDNTTYVSRDQADSFLAGDVGSAEGMVKGALSSQVTQGQFDAMVDFAFTMDGESFKNSDVVQKVNSGDIAGAATAMAQWCYGMQNGVLGRLEHLTARRTGNIHWLTMAIDPQPTS